MEDRREFLKKTALITAASLGSTAESVGAISSHRDSSWADEPVRTGDAGTPSDAAQPRDIRKLSQHFNEPGGDISPWMFIPTENIKKNSTAGKHHCSSPTRQGRRGGCT